MHIKKLGFRRGSDLSMLSVLVCLVAEIEGSKNYVRDLRGGLDPSKISGVGTNFGLLVDVFPGPNKRRALEKSILSS